MLSYVPKGDNDRCESHLIFVDASQAKVGQFDDVPIGNKYVLWFKVTMYDSVCMQKLDTGQHLVRK